MFKTLSVDIGAVAVPPSSGGVAAQVRIARQGLARRLAGAFVAEDAEDAEEQRQGADEVPSRTNSTSGTSPSFRSMESRICAWYVIRVVGSISCCFSASASASSLVRT